MNFWVDCCLYNLSKSFHGKCGVIPLEILMKFVFSFCFFFFFSFVFLKQRVEISKVNHMINRTNCGCLYTDARKIA